MTLIWILAAIVAIVIVGLVVFTARTAARVEQVLPPAGRFIEIGDQKIHYVDRGQGPVIVMIHGLGGNLNNFLYVLADRLAADHRVILFDRPGSGYSQRPANAPANLKAQAATIASAMRKLGLSRPLVVGHSLGGAVSLTLALEHPDEVGGLALLAPLTHARDEVPPAFKLLAIRSRLLRLAFAWTLATPLAIRNREAVMNMIFGPDPVPADFPLRGGGLLGLRPRAFMATSTDLLAINDDLPGLMPRYSTLRIPFAMLYGRGDRILDYRLDGEWMKQQVPALDLQLLDGGHMLPVSHAADCETIIRRTRARL